MTKAQRIGGRYDIVETIGDGGMGMVYRGIDTQTGSDVAIKSLKEELVQSSPILLERFEREGRMLRELDHPNIVKVLATINEAGAHYLVMEYVGGGTLKDVLQRQPQMPIKQVLRIALGLADALTRTHELGIIHRDVKLSNVLLTEGGTPRLTDFGIAQSNESDITKTGALMGTLLYLSPEAFLRQPLDERTDIWSFGVSLYELMSGSRPFRGDDMMSVMKAVLEGEMLPLERLRPDAPLPLVDLVYRMLERNRASRIPTMRLVGAELEHILRGLPATSPRLQIAAALANIASEDDNRFAISLPPVGQDPGLPPDLTPFVGRGRALRELKQLLADPIKPLITITGASGVGKSRLATCLARQHLPDFPHGVYYLDLDGIDDNSALIDGLNARIGHSPDFSEDARTTMLDFLRFKSVLLVLDHMDNLTAAGQILVALQKHAPQVRVVATSRKPLGVLGEHVYELKGMDYRAWKKVRTASEYPLTTLLLNRLHIAQPSYQLSSAELDGLNRVCARCKGNPLAITLAAGALQSLTMHALADALTEHHVGEFIDATTRQSFALDGSETPTRDTQQRVDDSVRAAFAILNGLLEAPAQMMLMRLSLFVQGFERDAALAVTEGELATLRQLQRVHLIDRRPDGRFVMHPALRVLGGELLAHQPGIEATTQAEYQAYFAAFALKHKYDLHGFRQRKAIADFREELPNLERAWHGMVDAGNERDMSRMIAPLSHYYWLDGRLAAGERTLRTAAAKLNTPSSQSNLNLTSTVLTRYGGFLAVSGGNADDAHNTLVQGLNIARHRHNLRDVAFAHLALGLIAEDRDAVFTHLQEAYAAADTAPHEFIKTRALLALSEWYAEAGREDKFDELNQRAQHNAQQQGDHYGEMAALQSLAVFASTQREHKLAIQAEQDLLNYFTRLGDRQNVIRTQLNIGYSSFKRGRLTQAHVALAAAATQAQALNDLVGLGQALALDVLVQSMKAQRDDAAARLDEAHTIARETNDPVTRGRLGVSDAHVALASDNLRRARLALHTGLPHAQRAGSATILCLYILFTAILRQRRGDLPTAARLMAYYFRQAVALGWLDRDAQVAALKAALSENLPEDAYRDMVRATRDLALDAIMAEVVAVLGR